MSGVGDTVLRDHLGGVAVLTLNRPDRLNAWTTELELRYAALLADADADDDVRAVVVTGAGRGYSAGWDMGELREVGEAGARADDTTESIAVGSTLACRKPLVAAINGSCAGLGLAQALACDLRFAAEGAKLTTSYARLGLVAEDGTSWLLPRVVGHAHALDLLLSSRVVLAEEALGMGLVNRVVPAERLLDEAVAYATELATLCAPRSMAAIKDQVRRDPSGDVGEALRESRALAAASLTHPDFQEGVAAFTEKRPPAFAPLGPNEGGSSR